MGSASPGSGMAPWPESCGSLGGWCSTPRHLTPHAYPIATPTFAGEVRIMGTMENPNDGLHLLFIHPTGKASAVPVIDDLTRKMVGAMRAARLGPHRYRGVHQCTGNGCSAISDNVDHYVNITDLFGTQSSSFEVLTNSLAVHYLAYHRDEVPAADLLRVAALIAREKEPTYGELTGTYNNGHLAQSAPAPRPPAADQQQPIASAAVGITYRTVSVPSYAHLPPSELHEGVVVGGAELPPHVPRTTGLCATYSEALDRGQRIQRGLCPRTEAPDGQAATGEMWGAAYKLELANIRDGGMCANAIEAALRAGIHTVEWAIASRYLVAGWV